MGTLQGAPQLRARLKALKLAFKPIGRAWADETVRRARATAPVRTGALRKSIRRKSASQKQAQVSAVYWYSFIEKGTREHVIRPKHAKRLRFSEGGRTIFARKVNHPRTAARPFGFAAAKEAHAHLHIRETLVDQWNGAA